MTVSVDRFRRESLEDGATLYRTVFNRPPWNDEWTDDTARARLEEILETPGYRGFGATLEGDGVGNGDEDIVNDGGRDVVGDGADESDVGGDSDDDGGDLVGLIAGNREQWDTGTRFYLRELCVHPDARQRGIGTALLERLCDELRSEGVERAYLLTMDESPARSFYEANGFSCDEETKLQSMQLNP